MTRKTAARVGWVAGVVVALGVGVLAGRATFVPPQVEDRALPVATHTVATAAVGSSVALPVTATWVTHPLPAGSASGMVTSIALDGASEVAPGDVLFAVDLRPVVAARGATPAFRDLAQGMRGDDVRQLQEFLVEGGFLRAAPNAVFGAGTTAAVNAWQRSLGLERTGMVAAGDLIFVESLPARLVLADDVVVGAVISPGQPVLSVVEDAPRFHMTSSSAMQAAVVPMTGAAVSVDAPDGSVWDAVVTGSERDDFGGTRLFLAGADGGPVCGDTCALVAFTGEEMTLQGRSVTAEEVYGPALPQAAVGTAADGSRFALLADGTRAPVTVLAADASRLIVEGVQAGDVVRLFATLDDTTPAGPTDIPTDQPANVDADAETGEASS